MKRKFLMLFLLLIVFGAWRYTQSFSVPGTDTDIVEAAVNVTFGRRGASCSGSGVCSFESQSSFSVKSSEINQTTGKLFLNSENRLVMKTDKTNLSNLLVEQYFSGETFLLQDTILVSEQIRDSLDFSGQIVILPGNYPIVETETAYEVIF